MIKSFSFLCCILAILCQVIANQQKNIVKEIDPSTIEGFTTEAPEEWTTVYWNKDWDNVLTPVKKNIAKDKNKQNGKPPKQKPDSKEKFQQLLGNLITGQSATVTIGDQNKPNKPKPSNTDARLAGSTAADVGQFPWMCLVNVYDSIDDGYIYGGCAILSRNYVLTAASLVVDAYSIGVETGGIDPFTMPVFTYGESIIFPGFKRNPLEHNIALIRLNQPLVFDATTSAVTLPASPLGIDIFNVEWTFNQRAVTVVGYGPILASEFLKNQNYYSTSVLDLPSCIIEMKSLRYTLYSPLQACLDSQSNTVGVCYSDVGDPVVLEGTDTLAGIVSRYFKCTDTPLFTRVRPYVAWIRRNSDVQ